MAHYVRERSDQDWYLGLAVPPVVIRNIDEKSKKALSSTGGTYAPSSPIIIGGEGLELQCGALLSGGATAFPGVGKSYIFGDDDYFRYPTPIARQITDSVLNLCPEPHTWGRETRALAAPTLALTPCLQSKRPRGLITIPTRFPDGVRPSAVSISYNVPFAHANVPQFLPSLRFVRISADGIITPHPNLTNGTLEPDGWVTINRPLTGLAYVSSGFMQGITLTFDTALVPRIDRTTYDYAVQWRDEGGDNAYTLKQWNQLFFLHLNFLSDELRPY